MYLYAKERLKITKGYSEDVNRRSIHNTTPIEKRQSTAHHAWLILILHLFVREYKRVETAAVYDTDCDFYMKGACFNIYQVATRRVPQVEQELPILPEHLSSSPEDLALISVHIAAYPRNI
jgi:hypothetical protein